MRLGSELSNNNLKKIYNIIRDTTKNSYLLNVLNDASNNIWEIQK